MMYNDYDDGDHDHDDDDDDDDIDGDDYDTRIYWGFPVFPYPGCQWPRGWLQHASTIYAEGRSPKLTFQCHWQ